MTSTKSLPLKQPIILLLKVEGIKSRSCSDMIGASKHGLVQMRQGRQKVVLHRNRLRKHCLI